MIHFQQNHGIFSTNVRISTLSALHDDAVWPQNIEVAIARIPAREVDGYSVDFIKKLATKLKNTLVKNGVVFFVMYCPVEKRSRPFEVAKEMEDVGFYHVDNIVIHKSWLPGKRAENTLVSAYELVLHFCNGTQWSLDRTPIAEYLKTDPERTCPGNLWQVRTGSLSEAYPVDLAELLIRKTDSLPGSVIFDPFMRGTGSLQASLKLGHSFYGFETDLKWIEKYRKIIAAYEKSRKKR